jgi:uncharacterized cupredoxin-like copper-binding protein
MNASRLALGILAACFLLGLAQAGENEATMDTIVVIGKRPQAMDYSEIIAAAARAATADFAELTIAPPRPEKPTAETEAGRGELAWSEKTNPLF